MKTWKRGKWLYRQAFRLESPKVHGWRTNWPGDYEYKQFLWWYTERFNSLTWRGRNMAAASGIRVTDYVK